MDLKISVCVPTWEQYNFGIKFLFELLESIKIQTYKNFNVIISDHSINDEINILIEKYQDDFEIKYFRYKEKQGNSPANTNNAIKNADGDIIKIMFQDDILFNNNSFDIINKKFNENNCEWLVNGCNHTLDGKNFNREMIPFWSENIIYGVNTISSPSVLSFKNKKENNLLFDENLIMLMDCEYYYQLYKKYGKPYILSEILTSNRIHNKQISSMYNKNINNEINYLKNKHKL